MQRNLKSFGLKSEKGFDDAEKDMKEAEGDLKGEKGQGGDQGSPSASGQAGKGAAVDAQGRAIEALREGAQGMQKQIGQGQVRDGKRGYDRAPACAPESGLATIRSAAGGRAIWAATKDR